MGGPGRRHPAGGGLVVGDRSEDTARRLRAALPAADRDRAIVCTDFWSAYLAAVPEERHAVAGKEAGLTNHVERFWCTSRQRCARFVRRALSFSECDRNHVGALWCFIRLDNRACRCRPRGHYPVVDGVAPARHPQPVGAGRGGRHPVAGGEANAAG